MQLFNEIKPLSKNGIYEGFRQIALYSLAFGKGGAFGEYGFEPDPSWFPLPAIVNGRRTFFVNIVGIIFYTDDEALAQVAALSTSEVQLRQSLRNARDTQTMVGADAALNAALNVGGALTISYVTIQSARLVAQTASAAQLSVMSKGAF